MVRVYLYGNPEKKKAGHAWEHERGQKLLSYAGKLPENEGSCHTNISHSGGYVVVAVSEIPVGVDIEAKREVNERIADKAFSEAEQRLIDSKSITLLQLWTLKESYGKSKGVGLAYPLKKVEFSPGEKSRDGVWQAFSCSDKNVCCYSCITEDYALSLCIQIPVEPEPELKLLQNVAWM